MKINYILLLYVCPFLMFAQTETERAITPINSTLTYQGEGESAAYVGTGEYEIYYDTVDGILDKPIIFVDGFDPNDNRTIPLMYSNLDFTGGNLGDLVRADGFDLVVLNFPTYVRPPGDGGETVNGGADFIQRNAFILVELLNVINGMKVGTVENVIIGPSMGGLISRYALTYMEQNAMDHETGLYISFDSPHLGANVPIGIQYLFNYALNGDPQLSEFEPLVEGLLNSAAAKQMLIDHYLAHIDPADGYSQIGSNLPAGAPNFRDAFQTELDAMGFPQNTRNVAITNGSGLGAMTGTPGMNLIDYIFDTGNVGGFDTRALIKLYFTPRDIGTIIVTDFVGQVDLTGAGTWSNAFTYDASAESSSPTMNSGLDSAPGGQFDMNTFDDGSSAAVAEFVANLNSQYFDFIPTLSALAITETSDWYALPDVTSRFNTPFAGTFIPDANEPHVLLTPANVQFALDEISQTLDVDDFTLRSVIRLQKNPITDALVILSSQMFSNTKVSIVDMTGKLVYSDVISLNNRTSIKLNLHSGLYILNLETPKNGSFRTKLLVN